MAALSPWMWFVGFAGLVALLFVFPNPIMLLIVLFGAHGDLAALEGAQVARGAGVLPGRRHATGCWSRPSTSA